MKGAIVYTWSKPVPGREAKGVEFMGETNARLEKYVADGTISDYAWYISGHSSSGLLIMRGEMEKLSELQSDPESLTANVKGSLLNVDFEWGYYVTGDTVDLLMGVYEQEVSAVG
jgi:hypothetical protein